MSEESQVEIKVGILSVIQNSLKPFSIKISSLLEGHFKKEFVFTNPDTLELMEVSLSDG